MVKVEACFGIRHDFPKLSPEKDIMKFVPTINYKLSLLRYKPEVGAGKQLLSEV